MLYKQFLLEQFLLEKYFVSVANCISKEIMSRFTRKSVSKSVTFFSRFILTSFTLTYLADAQMPTTYYIVPANLSQVQQTKIFILA